MKLSNLEEKFGTNGLIGARGEDKSFMILNQVFDHVIDDRQNSEAQSNGWDFQVTQPSWSSYIKIEVKTNLYHTPQGFKFPLEMEKYNQPGDFIKSQAHRFMHISQQTNDYLYYDHYLLRNYISQQLNQSNHPTHQLIKEAPGGDNAKLLWIHTTDQQFKTFLKIFPEN